MSSVIKSVEHVTLTLSSGTNPAQADLTKGQDEAACTPFYSIREAGAAIGSTSTLMPEVWLDDNVGTARVNAQLWSGDDVQVEIFVVEWDTTKVNVQQVTFTIATSATTGTAAITAVNQSKAFIVHNDRISSSGPFAYDRVFTSAAFTSDTQVTVTRSFASTAIAITGRIFVVECIGTEFSVQHATPSLTASGTTGDATISSVDTSKTFLVGAYTMPGVTTAVLHSAVWFELTSATNVQLQRLGGGTPNSTIDGSIFVVTCATDEWAVQRAQPTIAAAETSDDTTISAVDLTLAVINSCARMSFTFPHANETGAGLTYPVGMTLAATTTARAARRVAVAADGYYSFEVIEFAAAVAITPKTGSDTLSVGASEGTPGVLAGLTLADTLSLSISEAADLLVSLDTGDSLSLSISEATEIAVLLAAADSLSLSIAEAAEIAATLAASDSLTLSVGETSLLAVTVAAADALNLALGVGSPEPMEFFGGGQIEFFGGGPIEFFGSTGAGQETAAVAALLAAADSLSLSISETAGIAAVLAAADTLGISVTEAASIAAVLAAADTLGLSISEAAALSAVLSGSDTLSVGLTEIPPASTVKPPAHKVSYGLLKASPTTFVLVN